MKLLVTGSSGLVGSAAVEAYADRGWDVVGIDNDLRAKFFGPDGSTVENRSRLVSRYSNFRSLEVDIRDAEEIARIFRDVVPDLVIHAAAQPSHDLAARIPVEDFTVNANGTLAVLEAFRHHSPDGVFIHLSTNKVYGDNPNRLELVEKETRFDFASKEYHFGVPETFPIDGCTHSLFGVSKAAADLLAQEYGRNFGLKVGIFRGGCLTGAVHAAVELHGFLSYLVKCIVHRRPYVIYGYKGKQVRDQIDSRDVIRMFDAFYAAPRCGEVYNLGGGGSNAASILECVARIREATGEEFTPDYQEAARVGDHICYYSDLRKFMGHYPDWGIEIALDTIIDELVSYEMDRRSD